MLSRHDCITYSHMQTQTSNTATYNSASCLIAQVGMLQLVLQPRTNSSSLNKVFYHSITLKQMSQLKVTSSLYRWEGMLKNLYSCFSVDFQLNSHKLSKKQQAACHFWTGLSIL